jgi:RNA polymerase sigma-70 factor, ECF subfamily
VQPFYIVASLICRILNINLDWKKQGGVFLEKALISNQVEDLEACMEDYQYKLIKEAIRGEKESFVALIDLNKAYLYKTAYLYVKNEEDASEIYQNTVYKAYISVCNLKKPQHFKTWITRILINNVYDIFRRTSREAIIDEGQQIESIDELSGIEDRIDLYDAIDLLNYNLKTAVILRYIHDMPLKDIADIMSCSENTIKSHLHRAKKALFKSLKGE